MAPLAPRRGTASRVGSTAWRPPGRDPPRLAARAGGWSGRCLLQIARGRGTPARSGHRRRNRRSPRAAARPGRRERRHRRRNGPAQVRHRRLREARSRADPAVLRQRLRALQRRRLAIPQRALPPLARSRSSFTSSRSTRRVSPKAAREEPFADLPRVPLRRPRARPRGGGGRSGDALHPPPSRTCSFRPCRSSTWAPISAWSLPALLGPLDAATPVANDIPGQVELILDLLPDLENLAIVLGRSPIEQYWRAELARELEPFDRPSRPRLARRPAVRRRCAPRVASLPPHSAVLYVLLLVDAAGVPHELDTALQALAADSNAPTFGLFESQLGQGVVGGRLVSAATGRGSRGRRGCPACCAVSRRRGAHSGASQPSSPIFDSRQLDRWRIPPSRLPPRSEIRFDPPSAWTNYRWPLLGGLGIFALQSALIVGLLLQRRHRRSAEHEVRSLHGRLLATYEQERRRLARELHDDLTQRLARLAIDAAQVERQHLDAGRATRRCASCARSSSG